MKNGLQKPFIKGTWYTQVQGSPKIFREVFDFLLPKLVSEINKLRPLLGHIIAS